MSELNLEELSEKYSDVLKELGNIGAGNAMTALSQMVQTKIDMQVPQVKLLEMYEVGMLMGGEEQIMAAVFLGIEGDVDGSMMFIMDIPSAKHLINKVMMGMATEGDDFSEMELSALKEVGNIITGAYLNSLSTMTQLKIYPTPPDLAVDMVGAILSVPAVQFGAMGDQILLIQSKFFDEIEIDGYFILIPDMNSYKRILGSLGIAVDLE